MPPRSKKNSVLVQPVVETPVEPPVEVPAPAPVKKTRKVKVKAPEAIPVEPAAVVVEKAPKKPSKWLAALKEYNKDTGKYSIPKKGSEEYDQVRALMEKMTV